MVSVREDWHGFVGIMEVQQDSFSEVVQECIRTYIRVLVRTKKKSGP